MSGIKDAQETIATLVAEAARGEGVEDDLLGLF